MKKLFILLVLSSILPLCAMELPVERGKGGARRVSFKEMIDVVFFSENEPPLELLKKYDSASETDEDEFDDSAALSDLSSNERELEKFDALFYRIDVLKGQGRNSARVAEIDVAIRNPEVSLEKVEAMIAKLENEFVQPSGATSSVAWPRDDEEDSDGSDDTCKGEGIPLWALKRNDADEAREDDLSDSDGEEAKEGVIGDLDAADEYEADDHARLLKKDELRVKLNFLQNRGDEVSALLERLGREGADFAALERDIAVLEIEPEGAASTSSGWLKRAVQPHVLGKVAGVTLGVFIIGELTHRHVKKQRALDKPTVFDRMRQWIQRRYRGLVRGEKKQA